MANRYEGRQPIQIREIANAQNIPRQFLEQLLIVLKRAGLVRSIRGARGGYLLALPPEKITVLDVARCMEGEIEVIRGPVQSEVLRKFWERAGGGVQEILRVSIQDLAIEHGRLAKAFVYSI